MVTIDELLAEDNAMACLASFRNKRDGAGPDGMRISELDEWWRANGSLAKLKIRNGTYRPGMVHVYEISTNSGKQRQIASINAVDRLVEKLLQRRLQAEIAPQLLPHSLAYQEGKGTLDAAMLAREFIEKGMEYLCELDIRDYFGSINLGRLRKLCKPHLDEGCMRLLDAFLSREIAHDGEVSHMEVGILQGSALSPVLSNLYLHAFDQSMEDMELCWFRFSDNINVYCATAETAQSVYSTLRDELGQTHQLGLNKKKSGIYQALDRRVLGYDLCRNGDAIEVRRHAYIPRRSYSSWHESVVHKGHDAYYIVRDGVINRKDYSLLFEGEGERHHIPVGIIDQLNIYGSVAVTPEALRTISREGVRIAYYHDRGDLMGIYIPESHSKAAAVFLRQCELYNDPARRLDTARRMEIAAIHNMREVLRYYDRRGRADLSSFVKEMTACIIDANECRDISTLMLIEAKARRGYYRAFGHIIKPTGFSFEQRTRRPPKDPCNAMISFGNTVIYNRLLQIIWKTSLDPKIGVVHATNRRSYSLNLDFADIFKPIIVDRVIFSLVNRHEIRPAEHFREEGCGVYLNPEGKRLLLRHLDQKLDTRVGGKGGKQTYLQLLVAEVAAFQRLVRDGEKYRPYKYY